LRAGTFGQHWAISGRAAKEFSGVAIDDIMKTAKVAALPVDERFNPQLDFGAAAVFGGVSSALWLFALWKVGQAPLPGMS
jgi:hypothetical protein